MSSTLSFDQCLQSPCDTCSAPCCTFLPLHDFVMQTFDDVDYARYLLNFANIELAYVSGQTWRVHYVAPCSRLDKNGLCTLHGTVQKPQVCLNYNARSCFYQPMFLQPENTNFMRFDAERFEVLSKLLTFSDQGQLLELPSTEDLISQLPPFVFHPFEQIDLPTTRYKGSQTYGFTDLQSQCEGCSAWCCQTLSFPFGGIHAASNLDYIWFCLGFPNVELCVTEDSMSIFVHTRCRNLLSTTSGGCGVFGTSKRPLVCERYDGMSCAYKAQVGTEQSTSAVRVSVNDFAIFQEQFQLNGEGKVISQTPFTQIRDAIYRAR